MVLGFFTAFRMTGFLIFKDYADISHSLNIPVTIPTERSEVSANDSLVAQLSF
jgi:hypothetical protein